MANTVKGFIKNYAGERLLPITRAELVLDKEGKEALSSELFLAGKNRLGEIHQVGLVTAEERARLKGGEGQNVNDIYTKLGYINSSLKVGDVSLTFYDEANKATDIHFVSPEAGQLSISTVNNDISIGLKEISNQDLDYGSDGTNNEVIKSIKVDKYGRISEIKGGLLTNSEIPENLENKKFNGCTTTNGSSDDSLINKKYVDDAITQVTGIATGALHFVGALSSTQGALDALASDAENSYYKVTADFALSSEYLHLQHEIPAPYSEQIKIGDTLIKKDSKFIHIPSGDDVTSITIKKSNVDPVINDQVGPITFDFSDVFDISASYKHATITLPKAGNGEDGYLSADDHLKFTNYVNTLKVEYTPTVNANDYGFYEIGKIKIGETNETSIYGLNHTYSLSVENGTGEVNTNNPILRLTENTSKTIKDITYRGLNGIIVQKNGDSIEFLGNNKVGQDSTQYLSISNDQTFDVKLCKSSEDGSQIINGLIDYNTTHDLITGWATTFEVVGKSLTGSDSSATYIYGNDALISAVSVTI